MREDGESEALLQRAAEGNQEAVGALLRLHEPSLLAFLRIRAGASLGGRESAHDILQDILLQVTQNIGSFEYRGEAQFRGWLYTLAENRLRERIRHHKRAKRDRRRDRSMTDDTGGLDLVVRRIGVSEGPASELAREETLKGLEHALSQLSSQDQEILSLAAICGLSSAEIANQLGIEEETVRKRKTRARARLAALWGREST